MFPIDFLTGFSDGLIIPAMAGIIAFSFAAEQSMTIWCIVASCIGALSYGLARFWGEQKEIRHHHPVYSEEDAREEIILLRQIGIAEDIVEDISREVEKEKAAWLEEIEENDMGWELPARMRALKAALHTGTGFLAGGVLVCCSFAGLFSYMHIVVPVLPPLLALLLAGAGSGWLTGRKPAVVAGRQLLRGLAAYGTALLLARLLLTVLGTG